MSVIRLVLLLSCPLVLAACTTAGEGGPGLGDLGSSIGGGIGQSTLGTQRRMDVYGGSTAPSLPTSVSGGFR